jgi:hypothetical protein
MTNNRRLTFVVVAFLLSAGALLALLSPDWHPLTFKASEITSIEVHLAALSDRQTAAKVITHDPTKIQVVLTEIAKGKQTRDHKCGESGNLTLHRKDGGSVDIGILSGHHAEYYEFRVFRASGSGYSIYRTERAPFLEAMATLGLPELDPGLPE